MKRTIQINLAGTIFNIDDDAYENLRDYLNAVERQFMSSVEGREVMNDLETRMSELFSERLKPLRQVISIEDVREVLKVLGAPEDIGGHREGSQRYSQPYAGRYDGGRRSRRLYRDGQDKSIGGVCSGLAYYFNTDPLLLRILFVVGLFIGFGFLLYLVLWIALPQAQTLDQIREMKSGSYHF